MPVAMHSLPVATAGPSGLGARPDVALPTPDTQGETMITTATDERVTDHPTEGPTPASVWQAVAGSSISDELLAWPPDLFALTEVLVERSEAYRFVMAPPREQAWPPARLPHWSDAVASAARQWSAWVEDGTGEVPDLLAEEWRVFREGAGMPLGCLTEAHEWRLCEALLTLHAIADEACAGLGAALDAPDGKGRVYRARGRELLARTGSLARIRPCMLRVLPKARTPANSSSLRSFSRYACVQGPGVEVRWSKLPTRRDGSGPWAHHCNFLLLPWPLRVRDSDFRPLAGSVQAMDSEPFGLFEFAPADGLDLDLVDRMLVAARDEVDKIDCLCLPESAVEAGAIEDLEMLLDRHRVPFLCTGVRQRSEQPGSLGGNWVHFGVSPRLETGGRPPGAAGEQWLHIRQSKHHRWTLDEAQIYQYHLGGALHPHIRWWEATGVPRRSVQFVEIAGGITVAFLVCEDLAQNDAVADVIRSVGPTQVITPLLDGPQLRSRWAARYAGVFADDPGSAVLTLTSFGMAQRCRPHGRDSSPVVALWKDPARGIREISLEAGAQGILLTCSAGRTARRSMDGRRPIDNCTEYFDVGVHQVRASSTGSGSPPTRPVTPLPPALEVLELTILTSWAEAVAETLACGPERVEAALADASAGAPWRAALGVAEPSPRLGEALAAMGRLVRAAAGEGGHATLESLLVLLSETRPGEGRLDRLIRQVFRTTVEQLRTRQAMEAR
jgi:hypothetical protein